MISSDKILGLGDDQLANQYTIIFPDGIGGVGDLQKNQQNPQSKPESSCSGSSLRTGVGIHETYQATAFDN